MQQIVSMFAGYMHRYVLTGRCHWGVAGKEMFREGI